tara:strand:+ start:2075 stop:2317 length:243 start_codon:yes stop_codon:yes gene_type:complete
LWIIEFSAEAKFFPGPIELEGIGCLKCFLAVVYLTLYFLSKIIILPVSVAKIFILGFLLGSITAGDIVDSCSLKLVKKCR